LLFFFTTNSKELLIANKESLVCGASILLKKAKANNCKITSIDSEHFCIKQIIKDKSLNEIDSVFLTASGGPFLKKKEVLIHEPVLRKLQTTQSGAWEVKSQ